MPHQLEKQAFADSDANRVRDFECGEEVWAEAASIWINTKAQQAISRGNRVWLYLDGNDLVAFGSLGKTTWPDPPPRREYAYIPQLAIASQFQGGPRGVEREQKYSHQIMRDLIGEALLIGPNELALRVHEDNLPAIRLYETFDFHALPRRSRDNDYIRMIRLLR